MVERKGRKKGPTPRQQLARLLGRVVDVAPLPIEIKSDLQGLFAGTVGNQTIKTDKVRGLTIINATTQATVNITKRDTLASVTKGRRVVKAGVVKLETSTSEIGWGDEIKRRRVNAFSGSAFASVGEEPPQPPPPEK